MKDTRFWSSLDRLLSEHEIQIDRPAGFRHPNYPYIIYPFDYGYLEGTTSGDGDGIDVWVGSMADRRLDAVICAVDLDKRDMEVKLLVGCTCEEADRILRFHNEEGQSAVLIRRPMGDQDG